MTELVDRMGCKLTPTICPPAFDCPIWQQVFVILDKLLDTFNDAIRSSVLCKVNRNISSGSVDKVDHVFVPVYDTWRESTANIAMNELTEVTILPWLFLCEWYMSMGTFGTTATKRMVNVVFERWQTNRS